MKDSSPARPAFREALAFWFKLGWISFGGTAGHIAIMHDFLVEKRKWISNSRFFHALSFCMLLPGPEAQQLAIYIGWKLHGKKGGLAAGILFVFPSMIILLALSMLYVLYGDLPWMRAIFTGLKPAVIAIILIALFKIGKKALHGLLHLVVAMLAFGCIFFYNISLILILAGAILLALVINRFKQSLLRVATKEKAQEDADEREYYLNKYSPLPPGGNPIKRLPLQLAVFAGCWLLPLLGFYFWGADFGFWKTLILFFTQAAVFTIGGSYTVLPYVAQFAVGKLSWLSRVQMVDGFALAETTPGPLIIVVGFVGFMAGYHHSHGSLWVGSIALIATIYYTFLPCFLYIFAGGPIIERTHGNAVIEGVLGLVIAAVVGVILNLVLFLGRDVIFPGGVSLLHPDWLALGWVIVSLFLLVKGKMNVVYLILLSLAAGLIRYFIMG
jgi:chromate transporter